MPIREWSWSGHRGEGGLEVELLDFTLTERDHDDRGETATE